MVDACWSEKGELCRFIDTITLKNYRYRQGIKGLDPLINLCVVDDKRRLKWKESVKEYIEEMKIMRKKGEDYTDLELINKNYTRITSSKFW